MNIVILAISAIFCFLHMPMQIFAETSDNTYLIKSIAKESVDIQNASPNDYSLLSDLYASRGESYLILGEDQKALEDFLLSYEYALKGEETDLVSFRPLFGAFIVYARLENLEAVQEIHGHLERILKSYTCRSSKKSFPYLTQSHANEIVTQIANPDRPIEGPDHISVGECLSRVRTTVEAIILMIAVVKKTEIRILAATIINKLADAANDCCWAGGLWKGCLQKLANKIYYWGVFGIPADPAWD